MRSDIRAQQLGDHNQRGVAAIMAVGVVHALEIVNIAENDREDGRRAFAALLLLLKAFQHVAPVRKLSQRVKPRHALKLLLIAQQALIRLLQLPIRLPQLLLRPLQLDMRLDSGRQLIHIERLGDVIHAARLKSIEFINDVGQRGHKNDGNVLRVGLLFQAAAGVKSVHVRHHHVQ